MNTEQTEFDAEELVHIAMNAMNNKDVETSLRSLKASIQKKPDYAQAHFLLGAQYAEIGMIDRALEEMRASIKLVPDFWIARFQLGFLLLTLTRADEAAEVWGPLDEIGDEHPLLLFKKGLLSLANDEFGTARRLLIEGIERNNVNHALNRDMAMIIERIDRLTAEAAPADAGKQDDPAEELQHLAVAAYQDKSH
ncbi:MAG TPA: hypothetical protein VEC06_08840 [Paucimonas sp.]|nr:hypothetical protein [Paucimonas sp.]